MVNYKTKANIWGIIDQAQVQNVYDMKYKLQL